eukprot:scaffold23190_cov48-Phaeocystis_antarctica.AAC.2
MLWSHTMLSHHHHVVTLCRASSLFFSPGPRPHEQVVRPRRPQLICRLLGRATRGRAGRRWHAARVSAAGASCIGARLRRARREATRRALGQRRGHPLRHPRAARRPHPVRCRPRRRLGRPRRRAPLPLLALELPLRPRGVIISGRPRRPGPALRRGWSAAVGNPALEVLVARKAAGCRPGCPGTRRLRIGLHRLRLRRHHLQLRIQIWIHSHLKRRLPRCRSKPAASAEVEAPAARLPHTTAQGAPTALRGALRGPALRCPLRRARLLPRRRCRRCGGCRAGLGSEEEVAPSTSRLRVGHLLLVLAGLGTGPRPGHDRRRTRRRRIVRRLRLVRFVRLRRFVHGLTGLQAGGLAVRVHERRRRGRGEPTPQPGDLTPQSGLARAHGLELRVLRLSRLPHLPHLPRARPHRLERGGGLSLLRLERHQLPLVRVRIRVRVGGWVRVGLGLVYSNLCPLELLLETRDLLARDAELGAQLGRPAPRLAQLSQHLAQTRRSHLGALDRLRRRALGVPPRDPQLG